MLVAIHVPGSIPRFFDRHLDGTGRNWTELDGTGRNWTELVEMYKLTATQTGISVGLRHSTTCSSVNLEVLINLLVIGGDPSGIGGPSDFGLFDPTLHPYQSS